MPNQPARRSNSEVRAHSKALDRIDRKEEEARKLIGAIARTTTLAMMTGLCVSNMRSTAEQMNPSSAAKMAMFDLASAMATANVIQDVASGC